MNEWVPIYTWQRIANAPKDGRFIDSYNAHNGERRVTRWVGEHSDPMVHNNILSPWAGWGGNWGNGPTHFQELPQP